MALSRDDDPRWVGGYELGSKLGEGGMGQVFLGVDAAGERVAVKLLKPELAGHPEFRTRFAREVEAARRVSGAHTAAVVDADPLADPPWLACEYIAGPSLQQRVSEEGPLDSVVVGDLAARLADGLSDIHRAGLVHRDLKPSNVIMAKDGPRIIDFGISRAADASTLTVAGTVVGTYAYMAPEQIIADTATEASDVFALGCVLAFAATGTGPFDANSIPAIVHRVTSEPPRLEGISGELRELIAACLAKDPGNRPSVDDVRGLSRSEVPQGFAPTVVDTSPPVESPVAPGDAPTVFVPPPSPPVPLLRRRGVLIGGIAALCVVVAAVTGVVVLWPQSTSGGSQDTADKDALDFEVADRRTLDPPDMTYSLAFSPDGKLLATGSPFGRRTELWNVDTGEQVAELDGTGACAQAFSPDGEVLATGGCSGLDTGVQLWDVRSESKIATVTGNDSDTLAFSPDGKTLAAVGTDPDDGVRLFDVSTTDEIMRIDIGDNHDFTFSPDSATFAVTTFPDDSDAPVEAELWDVRGGDKISTFTADGGEVVFGPDGKTLITANDGVTASTITRWDTRSGDKIDTLDIGPCFDLSFSPDRKVVATANDSEDEDGGTTLWNTETGERLLDLGKETGYQVAFNDTGNAVATNTVIDEEHARDEIILWRLK